jgi:hypothetical protein
MARKKATPDELEARAEANGYQRGAHREEDSRRDGNKQRGQGQERSRCNVGPLCDVRERYLYPKTVDIEVESQLALPDDEKGCSPHYKQLPSHVFCRSSE